MIDHSLMCQGFAPFQALNVQNLNLEQKFKESRNVERCTSARMGQRIHVLAFFFVISKRTSNS
jgi:hypothetical protein